MATSDIANFFLSALTAPYPPQSDLRLEIRPLHPAWRKDALHPDCEAPYYWASRTPYGAREWYPLTPRGIQAAVRHSVSLGSAYEVYFGVLPRVGRAGKQSDVPLAFWLWCDVDGGSDGVEGALRLIERSGLPPPHLIVVSGGGGHLYWRLAEFVPLSDEAARKRFKEVLKRLCLKIGGCSPGAHADSSRADTASILRVPGTFNRKRVDEPRPVYLLRHELDEGLPYTWWRANLPAIPVPPARKPLPASPIAQGVGLVRWARTPYAEGNRHNDLTGAAAWLVREVGLDAHVAEELLRMKADASIGMRQITDDEVRSMVQWAAR